MAVLLSNESHRLPQTTPRRSPKGWLNWKVWMRSVHLYLSLLGLVFALFFAASGFMLNHGDWFGLGEKHKVSEQGRLEQELGDALDRLAVVEELRADFGITAPLVELDVQPEELYARFSRPGEDVDVYIQRADGSVELERERGGVLDVLTDLHKGERSGTLGGLLVDAAAVFLLLFSLTGFALWLSLPKRRAAGLWALGISLALVLGLGGYLVS